MKKPNKPAVVKHKPSVFVTSPPMPMGALCYTLQVEAPVQQHLVYVLSHLRRARLHLTQHDPAEVAMELCHAEQEIGLAMYKPV
jgi:copper(I)-binding protein